MVYKVCPSIYTFWIHDCIVKPNCSIFRKNTVNFLGVLILYFYGTVELNSINNATHSV